MRFKGCKILKKLSIIIAQINQETFLKNCPGCINLDLCLF